MTLAVLRLIGEELRKDRTARVIAQVPVAVATYLINEKREWLRTLEDKSTAELIIVPNENIQTPGVLDPARARRRDGAAREQAAHLPDARGPRGRRARQRPGQASPQPEAPAVATLLPSDVRAGRRPGGRARAARLRRGRPPRRRRWRLLVTLQEDAGRRAGTRRRRAGRRRERPGPARVRRGARKAATTRRPRAPAAFALRREGARRDRGDGRRSEGRDRDRNRDHRGQQRAAIATAIVTAAAVPSAPVNAVQRHRAPREPAA